MLRGILQPKVRRWIYGIVLATAPILGIYGIVAEEALPLWIALAEAVLVPTLALPNTPKGGVDGDG